MVTHTHTVTHTHAHMVTHTHTHMVTHTWSHTHTHTLQADLTQYTTALESAGADPTPLSYLKRWK